MYVRNHISRATSTIFSAVCMMFDEYDIHNKTMALSFVHTDIFFIGMLILYTGIYGDEISQSGSIIVVIPLLRLSL